MKKRSKILFLFISIILLASICIAQETITSTTSEITKKEVPINVITWQKTYGKDNWDEAYSIQQTKDGDYIVAGYTCSFGLGNADVYVLKIDKNGKLLWQKNYGKEYDEKVYSIWQTTDGGYIATGYIWSSDNTNTEVYVLRLDKDGNLQWQKTYGGKKDETAYSIQQTKDGGYIVAGETESFSAGENDAYVLKIDKNGNLQWQKNFGKSSYDAAHSIQQVADGGYIVAADTFPLRAGGYDVYVIKLDENGNLQWQTTYGGSKGEIAYSIQQTKDGGYIVAGGTYSFGTGNEDVYVLKLDENGNLQWQKTYGGEDRDFAYSIQQTKDGGYIVAGGTYSFGAENEDVYILKLKEDGSLEWQKTFGGRNYDEARSILQTTDGGYIAAGYTDSFGVGTRDVYVIKIDANGNSGPYPSKNK